MIHKICRAGVSWSVAGHVRGCSLALWCTPHGGRWSGCRSFSGSGSEWLLTRIMHRVYQGMQGGSYRAWHYLHPFCDMLLSCHEHGMHTARLCDALSTCCKEIHAMSLVLLGTIECK